MIQIHSFTFNPFQENTYILSDETNECVIIDSGAYNADEKQELKDFIAQKGLAPVHLLNTHCHIDHVFGNSFVAKEYDLKPQMHKADLPVLEAVPKVAHMYGIPNVDTPPEPGKFLDEGDVIEFGNSKLDILFTPGHAPGHIVFWNQEQEFIIAGDDLFQGSIGRTDLPGGDHDALIKSIKEKLFPLGDNFQVYPGHGPATNIGFEKKNNPFLQ